MKHTVSPAKMTLGAGNVILQVFISSHREADGLPENANTIFDSVSPTMSHEVATVPLSILVNSVPILRSVSVVAPSHEVPDVECLYSAPELPLFVQGFYGRLLVKGLIRQVIPLPYLIQQPEREVAIPYEERTCTDTALTQFPSDQKVCVGRKKTSDVNLVIRNRGV
jgi:hypothetical protein